MNKKVPLPIFALTALLAIVLSITVAVMGVEYYHLACRSQNQYNTIMEIKTALDEATEGLEYEH